jgi:predicted DNA-binding transcriptional regulator AlpA
MAGGGSILIQMQSGQRPRCIWIRRTEMDLLTTSEVAEMTRKPVATLRWYRHEGIGPKSGRLGGRVVYRRADVEAWIEEQLEGSSSGGTAA